MKNSVTSSAIRSALPQIKTPYCSTKKERVGTFCVYEILQERYKAEKMLFINLIIFCDKDKCHPHLTSLAQHIDKAGGKHRYN
jgi:hypothetical protein